MSGNAVIRFDGLYVAPPRPRSDFHSYLRFYADGCVVGVASGGDAEKVARWFTRDWKPNGSRSVGRYRLYGDVIRFRLNNEAPWDQSQDKEAVADFQGRICGEELPLHIHVPGSGFTDDRLYKFVCVPVV